MASASTSASASASASPLTLTSRQYCTLTNRYRLPNFPESSGWVPTQQELDDYTYSLSLIADTLEDADDIRMGAYRELITQQKCPGINVCVQIPCFDNADGNCYEWYAPELTTKATRLDSKRTYLFHTLNTLYKSHRHSAPSIFVEFPTLRSAVRAYVKAWLIHHKMLEQTEVRL